MAYKIIQKRDELKVKESGWAKVLPKVAIKLFGMKPQISVYEKDAEGELTEKSEPLPNLEQVFVVTATNFNKSLTAQRLDAWLEVDMSYSYGTAPLKEVTRRLMQYTRDNMGKDRLYQLPPGVSIDREAAQREIGDMLPEDCRNLDDLARFYEKKMQKAQKR
ncbi:hypothetical protein KY331_00570 [Candidatus Woesearchaeota archaeon]|nr:hypothetical protein [Candidatus Woesearchaeota archaeon]